MLVTQKVKFHGIHGPLKYPPESGCISTCSGSYIDSIGYCQKGDACIFAHSPAELANGDDRSHFEAIVRFETLNFAEHERRAIE